jgi:hypothetical protein
MTTPDDDLVRLDPHTRGDPFVYTTPPLADDWLFSDFDEVVLTIRKRWPSSTVTADTDAGVVDQAKLSDSEIVPSGDSTQATITIPSSRTTTWPAARDLVFDVQATILGGVGQEDQSLTIGRGILPMRPDATRAP